LGWFHKSEGFARTVFETGSEPIQVGGVVNGEVGSLRHVLAQEAVGVLVRGTLPGAVGVAEVDLDGGVDGELGVSRHLLTLIPGELRRRASGSPMMVFSMA
jgi:hypothetical protein